MINNQISIDTILQNNWKQSLSNHNLVYFIHLGINCFKITPMSFKCFFQHCISIWTPYPWAQGKPKTTFHNVLSHFLSTSVGHILCNIRNTLQSLESYDIFNNILFILSEFDYVLFLCEWLLIKIGPSFHDLLGCFIFDKYLYYAPLVVTL